MSHLVPDAEATRGWGEPVEILLLRRLGELLLSASDGIDDVGTAVEDTRSGLNASTNEASPAHFLFSSSSGTDDTTNTLEDTWESGETGTKEGSEEHVLLLSSSGSTNNVSSAVKETWAGSYTQQTVPTKTQVEISE